MPRASKADRKPLKKVLTHQDKKIGQEMNLMQDQKAHGEKTFE